MVLKHAIELTWSFQNYWGFLRKPLNLSCFVGNHGLQAVNMTLTNTTTRVKLSKLQANTTYQCAIETGFYTRGGEEAICKRRFEFSALTKDTRKLLNH